MWCLPWPSPLPPSPLPFEPAFPLLPVSPEPLWLERGATGTTAGDTPAPAVKRGPAPSVAPPWAGGKESAGEDDGIRSAGAGAWCFGRLELFRDDFGFAGGLGVAAGLDAGENERGVVTG